MLVNRGIAYVSANLTLNVWFIKCFQLQPFLDVVIDIFFILYPGCKPGFIVAALQVLRIMMETGKSLSELAKLVKQFPQVLLNVAVKTKPPLDSIQGYSQVVKAVERQLDKRGRVIVRYSGTEKICRVMVEGEEKTQVDTFAHSIAEVIKQGIGA